MKNKNKLVKKIVMIAMSLSLLLLTPSQYTTLQDQTSIEILSVKAAIPVPITTVADPVDH